MRVNDRRRSALRRHHEPEEETIDMPALQLTRTARWTLCATAVAFAGCTTGDKAAEGAALAQYAPRSPNAAIKAVSLSSSDRNTFDPTRAGTAYADTTRQVVVWYRWAGADPAAKVAIHWFKGDNQVLEQGEAFAKPAGSSAWVLKMDAGGTLPSGNYRVDLLENDKPVTSIPFNIGTEQTATASSAPQASASSPDTASADTASAAPAPADTSSSGSAVAETTAAAAAAPATNPTPSQGKAAQGLETKWPGVFAEVNEFQRKGNTLTAKLRFTNRGAKDAEPDLFYSETYLLDADNKKYEVLKDEEGRYLAALRTGFANRWYERIEPGASQTIWMKFQAPPKTVKTVALQVPGMEPFEELTIQDK